MTGHFQLLVVFVIYTTLSFDLVNKLFLRRYWQSLSQEVGERESLCDTVTTRLGREGAYVTLSPPGWGERESLHLTLLSPPGGWGEREPM